MTRLDKKVTVTEVGDAVVAIPQYGLLCPHCGAQIFTAYANRSEAEGFGAQGGAWEWVSDGDTIPGLWGQLSDGQKHPDGFHYGVLTGECIACDQNYYIVTASFMDVAMDLLGTTCMGARARQWSGISCVLWKGKTRGCSSCSGHPLGGCMHICLARTVWTARQAWTWRMGFVHVCRRQKLGLLRKFGAMQGRCCLGIGTACVHSKWGRSPHAPSAPDSNASLPSAIPRRPRSYAQPAIAPWRWCVAGVGMDIFPTFPT